MSCTIRKCLTGLVVLPVCAVAHSGYINILLGKNFSALGQKNQTVSFGSFTNRYVPNNDTHSSKVVGIESGYQFTLSPHLQDQLGLLVSKSVGMVLRGTENRMIYQSDPPPDMRYHFKMNLTTLAVANAFKIPFGRFSIRVLSQFGMVFNKVYDWSTYPIDASQPPASGAVFNGKTKLNVTAGIGAGFAVRLTSYMNIGANYLFQYIGCNKFGPQSGQTTSDRFRVSEDAVNTAYINLQFII